MSNNSANSVELTDKIRVLEQQLRNCKEEWNK